ncbi:hypothetical protein [Oceanobacillus oncorhynchi]|uniref:hypothetical protein n=1 Tax=Oceanobacillus oncorhynchi TaxID=545501 RepID=UPI0018692983|nr:hypothetical protein [Oceanobacillus oncorhynchi]
MNSENQKYLVASLNERNKVIAKLKSNIFSIKIDELVKKAIDAFEAEIPAVTCHRCNKQAVITSKSMDYPIPFNEECHNIVLHNFPRGYCKYCEKDILELRTMAALEELIKFEVLYNLKYEKELPKELDFKKLIVMSSEE